MTEEKIHMFKKAVIFIKDVLLIIFICAVCATALAILSPLVIFPGIPYCIWRFLIKPDPNTIKQSESDV